MDWLRKILDVLTPEEGALSMSGLLLSWRPLPEEAPLRRRA